MSRTAVIGVLGLAHQTAKGTANTSFTYVPATNLGVNANQQVQATPYEISGGYFQKTSYKTSVSAGGDTSIIARPDSFGHVLYALSGQDTVTPVPSQAGAFSHVFTPFTPSASNELPWYTLYKNVSYLWANQFTDVKCAGVRFDVAARNLVNTQVSWYGITPTEVAVPGAPPAADSGPVFQTCQGTVILHTEAGDANISANTNKLERVSLDFVNNLSADQEFSVGSYVPDDVTLLSRSVNVSADIIIRDPDLVRAVYQNGGTGAWDPTVYRGHLNLTFNSSAVVPSTTQPYQFIIDLPGIDFLMMPVSLSSNQLIRATLSANVTLGAANDQYAFTLINGTASY